MAQYIRVVRRGSINARVELPDHSTQLVPLKELPLWDLVMAMANTKKSTEPSPEQEQLSLDPPAKEAKKAKEAAPKKARKAKAQGSNGLGIDHPYETVNMEPESVPYDDETDAPF